jgi:hypothetical protein
MRSFSKTLGTASNSVGTYLTGASGPGMTNGQGSDQFGAKWWLISPAGGQVGSSSGP